MGKSVAPYSHVIDPAEAAFAPFRRTLRKEDQQRLDTLFNLARWHTPSGVAQSDPDPFRPILLSVLIEILHLLEEHPSEARGGDSL